MLLEKSGGFLWPCLQFEGQPKVRGERIMGMDLNAFVPIMSNPTVSLSVTATTGTATLASLGDLQNGNVMIYNKGPNDCFITAGASATTSATISGSMVIPSGFYGTFGYPGATTHIAGICNSGESTTIYFCRGYGN